MHKSDFRPTMAPNLIRLLAAVLLPVTRLVATGSEPEKVGAVLKQLGYQQIELRRTGENHLFIFGQVNGRRRSCLVDTGWSISTITTNTAQRLSHPGIIDELKLGRVTLSNQTAVAQDLRVNGQTAAFDVVLGCDFLIRHRAVIDCMERRLYLRQAQLANEATIKLAGTLKQWDYLAIKINLQDPPALTCSAKFNHREVELLVDTGAMWSCLDIETMRNLKLQVYPSASRITGTAATGKRGFGITRVARFEFDKWEKTDVNFAVLSLADWGLGITGQVLSNVGGILGGDELTASAAVIDCGQLKLWLRGRK